MTITPILARIGGFFAFIYIIMNVLFGYCIKKCQIKRLVRMILEEDSSEGDKEKVTKNLLERQLPESKYLLFDRVEKVEE